MLYPKIFKNNREPVSKLFKRNEASGFIQIIILIIAALVLLKYIYDIDIVGFLTEGRFKEILDRIYEFGSNGWAKYSGAVLKIWNYIIEFLKNFLARFK